MKKALRIILIAGCSSLESTVRAVGRAEGIELHTINENVSIPTLEFAIKNYNAGMLLKYPVLRDEKPSSKFIGKPRNNFRKR